MNEEKLVLLNDGFFQDLYLSFCSTADCLPDQMSGPSIRFQYMIHYVLKGQGIVSLRNSQYSLSENQALLIPPKVSASFQADTVSPWSYLWVGFSGKIVPTLVSSMGLLQEPLIFSCDHSSKIHSIARQMLISSKGTFDQVLLRQSLLASFLSELRNESKPQCQNLSEHENFYVSKAMEYIKQNYSNPIHVSEIASYLGISRNYLFTLFKEAFFCSPQEFISNYRLKQAAELLAATSLSIESIASACGYSDPAIFSKAFKKKYQMPPSQYRN